ncbi:hypothetical protein EIG74_02865 [Escherichia coli O10]|nr:hypothetical protein [Escherichia coli O10]
MVAPLFFGSWYKLGIPIGIFSVSNANNNFFNRTRYSTLQKKSQYSPPSKNANNITSLINLIWHT